MSEIITIGEKIDTSWIFKDKKVETISKEFDFFDEISETSTWPPFEHQRKAINSGVKKLISDGFFALFMDMGTGKTKTTIDIFSVLVHEKLASGLIVMCPKPLMAVWEDEIPKHSSLKIAVYRWDRRTTKKAEAEYKAFMDEKGPKAFIINIEAFQTPNDMMRSRLFSFMDNNKCFGIVDESSYIKESSAHRTKNITKFMNRLPFRMILTGTEIVNSPLDLFAQFEAMKNGFWDVKSFYLFQLKFAILADQYGSGGRTFKKVVGYRKLEELLDRITPFVFRARKEDCLDLPAKIYQVLHVELSAAQRSAYDSLKKHLVAVLESGEILSVANKVSLFTKFRQIPGGLVKIEGLDTVIEKDPPKLQALLADIAEWTGPVIVWAAFTHEILLLVENLSKIGPTVAFYGDIKQEQRDANVRSFQKGDARFFVGNPQSAGFGLNLQVCHLQYVYSRHLSPAVNWQAEDRTDRMGQEHQCIYKSLVAK